LAEKRPITGRQIAAGRVLAGIGQERLARLAGIPVTMLRRMEAGNGPPSAPADTISAVETTLKNFGVNFIAENGGGVGVRLKFNSSEVRRIGTLENEGGIVGEDDV
jgi:hypothetical protein